MTISPLQKATELNVTQTGPRFRLQGVVEKNDCFITYEAEDVVTGSPCRVRELAFEGLMMRVGEGMEVAPADAALRDTAVARWADDARVMQKIRHRNVGRIREVWAERGTAFAAEEPTEGQTLPDPLAPGFLPGRWTDLEQHVLSLLNAVLAMHGAGQVHGDLSPGALVVQKSGPLLLVPCTGGRTLDALRGRRRVGERRPWAAPEADLSGAERRVGPSSDLYSMALIILASLTEIPREENVPLSAAQRRARAEADGQDPFDAAVDALRGQIPAAWSTALKLCLAIDPAARPEHAQALGKLLRSAPADGRKVAVASESPRAAMPERPAPAANLADLAKAGAQDTAEMAAKGLSVGARLLLVGGAVAALFLSAWFLVWRPVLSEGSQSAQTFARNAERMDEAAKVAIRGTDEEFDEHGRPIPRSGAAAAPAAAAGSLATASSPSAAASTAGSAPLRPAPAPRPPRTFETQGWVRVEPAEFRMGSPETELGRAGDESQHVVEITRAFLISPREVTQAEWMAVSGTDPSFHASKPDTHPVERINWYAAAAYANWLSLREGLIPCYQFEPSTCADLPEKWVGGAPTCESASLALHACSGYRLPTESEWELAARAGAWQATSAGDLTATGDQPQSVLDPIAWSIANSAMSTHPVGEKQPNAWGLFDVSGNVSEWVHDGYLPYPSAPTRDPVGGSSANRVRRGGSWTSNAEDVRLAARAHNPATGRYGSVGFRLAVDAP